MSRHQQVRFGSPVNQQAVWHLLVFATSGEPREQLETRGDASKDFIPCFAQFSTGRGFFPLCFADARVLCKCIATSHGRDVSKGTSLVDPCCERDCRICVIGSLLSPGELLETDMIPNWVACKNERQGMRRREGKVNGQIVSKITGKMEC